MIMTPEQKETYSLVWPNPGFRWGNRPNTDGRRSAEDFQWMNKTFAEATDMCPPVSIDRWRADNSYIDSLSDHLERKARKAGLKNRFGRMDFINSQQSETALPQEETLPEVTLPQEENLPEATLPQEESIPEATQETAEHRLLRCIVLAMAIALFILIIRAA
jgi:hypothetical protein